MDNNSLRLPSNLDIKSTSPLVEALLPLRGADLQIEASGVTHLGSQCLQLLLSAKKTWESEGFFCHITSPSEAFGEGLEHLGFPRDYFSAQIVDESKEILL